MSNFANKQFEGTLYTFTHLQPTRLKVPLNMDGTIAIDMHVTFGCHCFTEGFDGTVHRADHRYTHGHETRAFDTLRYQCSLQLPRLVLSMLKGKIYRADDSFTYAAQISLASGTAMQDYSIFFNLEKDKHAKAPALRMFVKSAYLKPLVAMPNAQNWRFVSLAGQIAAVFPPKEKKPKQPKKKAPKGLISTS